MKGKAVRSKQTEKMFSIRRKIILFLIVIIVVFSGVTIAFIGSTLNRNSIKRFNRIVPRDLYYIANSFQLFFNSSNAVLSALAEDEDVRNADDTLYSYVSSAKKIKVADTVKSEMEKKLVKKFKNTFSNFPEYVEVYLGTKWGGYATSFDGEMPAGYDPRKRMWYQMASGKRKR